MEATYIELLHTIRKLCPAQDINLEKVAQRLELTITRDFYVRAVTLDPTFAQAWDNIGMTMEEGERVSAGDLVNATERDFYVRAVTLDPTYAQAWNNIGVTIEDNFERVCARDPFPPSYAQLARGNIGSIMERVSAGDLVNATARDFYVRAVTLDPTYAQAWNNLGMIMRRWETVRIGTQTFTSDQCLCFASGQVPPKFVPDRTWIFTFHTSHFRSAPRPPPYRMRVGHIMTYRLHTQTSTRKTSARCTYVASAESIFAKAFKQNADIQTYIETITSRVQRTKLLLAHDCNFSVQCIVCQENCRIGRTSFVLFCAVCMIPICVPCYTGSIKAHMTSCGNCRTEFVPYIQ